MLNSNRDQPQYWRERAEDALTDAESASDLKVKAKLLGVARAYDVIAQRAEKKIKLVPRAFQGAEYAVVVAGPALHLGNGPRVSLIMIAIEMWCSRPYS